MILTDDKNQIEHKTLQKIYSTLFIYYMKIQNASSSRLYSRLFSRLHNRL